MQLQFRPFAGFLGICALSCAILVSLPGCEKKDEAETEGASASTAEGADAPKGPCADYAKQVCDKAGESSSGCQSVKSAADLLSPKACKAAVEDISVTFKKLSEQRAACDELVKKLCAEVGPKTETCQMVTKQTEQFPPERCKKMLSQSDRIAADLKRREAANQPLSAEQQAAIAEKGAPAFGPEGAKVTVVEFSDFECPYCSRAANVVSKIKENYGDKVRFVFRQFPLSSHKNAHAASQAALAAHDQGKFWEYHDKLFENQRALDRASLEKYAKELGIKKLPSALDEKKYEEQVNADMKLGQQVSVSGTPTLFVNGKRVSNPTDYNVVKSEIEAAL